MNTKAKPQPTEIDHIRNTLADVVDGLGQTRGEMHQRFDQQEKEHSQFRQEVNERFGGLEHEVHEVKVRFDGLEQKVDRQGSEISEIKEMLQVLLSRQ
ncbi:hypothetical protein [Endozoicomonas sp. 8E]|uniref:hypothetical protein n=1 Tax=Endozoicomonas sp. 8E TaxID=3035692 RepID=UPI00293934B6|nr:hypothetical protein [Endozoicomonas sp. 8E]WOG25951.1 hypothetical protein P6910_15375 [Endozoicomonas sp. 8E]